MKYLLDSNTFIQASGEYYGMAICPAYWEWLIRANNEDKIESLEMVKAELLKGNDELSDWVKDNSSIFIPESDVAIQEAFGSVAACVMSLTHMNAGVHEEFLAGADPWLIAAAMAKGYTVVTQEALKPDNIKRKIHIPNICKMMSVPYMNTFEMLNTLKAEFILP